jgi:replicative DNA helicase
MIDSFDSEQAVIGAVLQEPDCLTRIDLNYNEFSHQLNGEIYKAILELTKSDQQPDFITVSNLLKERTGDNWLPMVVEMQKNSTGARNIKVYADHIRECYRKRNAMSVAESLMEAVQGDLGLSAIDKAISDLMALERTQESCEHTIKNCVAGALSIIEKAVESKELPGVKTGLSKLDSSLGGFQSKDLIVVGARPAMGKTALMLNFINSADVPVGVISSEMGHDQVGLRMLSLKGEVNAHKLKLAKLNDQEWTRTNNAVAMLSTINAHVNDKPGINIIEIQRQARSWKFKYKIEALYIDYIQRIKATDLKQSRADQVGEVTFGLKELARELDIPVIALAQVNRSVDSRPDQRPHMSDLKDSGVIEQEADIVMTLFRPEVYSNDHTHKGLAEILVEKNRHGSTGRICVNWIAEYMKFQDIPERNDGY